MTTTERNARTASIRAAELAPENDAELCDWGLDAPGCYAELRLSYGELETARAVFPWFGHDHEDSELNAGKPVRYNRHSLETWLDAADAHVARTPSRAARDLAARVRRASCVLRDPPNYDVQAEALIGWTDAPGGGQTRSYRGLLMFAGGSGWRVSSGSGALVHTRGTADSIDAAKLAAFVAVRDNKPAGAAPSPSMSSRNPDPSRLSLRVQNLLAHNRLPPAEKKRIQAENSESYAEHLREKLDVMKMRPRLPVASSTMRHGLENDVASAREKLEKCEVELAAAQRKPDHQPSKAALVRKRSAYVAVARLELEIAEHVLGPAPTAPNKSRRAS